MVDLESYMNTSRFSKSKDYLWCIKDMDKSLITVIVLGQVIPFTIKFKDLKDQNVTSLFKRVGSKNL